MAYVDWSQRAVTVEQAEHPTRGIELRLGLDAEARLKLATHLESVFSPGKGEIRLELPSRWTVYWKAREGETRLLLAHPEHDVWVATVAVDVAIAGELVSRLRSLQAGAELVLGELPGVARMSNVEIRLRAS